MAEYVAVDTSTPHGGSDLFTVGVAVEVEDKDLFRENYFEVVGDFLSRYEISIPFDVIKSKNIVDRVPSYQIKDQMSSLIKGLVRNPGISRINVSIGWYGDEVNLEYNDKNPMNGNTFVSNFLKQYFNVVTLWQYHHSHDYNLAEKALIDDVNGKITGSWQYIGNVFDVDIIPSGDITYPAISTADIIAYNIQGILNGHESTKYTDYPDIAQDYLIRRRGDNGNAYITGDYVNEADTDQIVPTLPYSIKSEIHHPHPILFVYDDVFSDNDMLKETDFHAYCRQWAFEREGTVVTWQQDHMPAIIHDEDVVVYTKGTDPKPIELLQDLNPTRQFSVLESGELLDDLRR